MNRIYKMEEAPEQYDLAGKVIGGAMKVHSKLGSGFLESVYRNALGWELRNAGLSVEPEKQIAVQYEGQLVGSFAADMFVNGVLIVEIKAVQMLAKIHEVQLVNYLTATGLDDGLLLNFGTTRFEFKRKFRTRRDESVSF